MTKPRYDVDARPADEYDYDPYTNAADTPDDLLDDWQHETLPGIDELPVGTSLKLDGPPGTGKSTNLIGRALMQARRDNLNPEDIAYATFRRSLAVELLQRCKDHGLVDGSDLVNPTSGATRNFGSVHAVTLRNIDGVDEMADDDHRRDFCREILNIPYDTDDTEDGPGEALFSVFSWLMSNRKPVENAGECPQYTDLMNVYPRPNPDLKTIWEMWNEYKDTPEIRSDEYQGDGILWDFDELFIQALTRGVTPDVELLIVDELHDVYPLMWEVVKMWIEDTLNRGGTVLVAGDPLQVVNSHQGASPEYFKKVDLPTLKLRQSFRVPYRHWEIASAVLGQSFRVPDVQPRDDPGIVTLRDAPMWGYSDDHPDEDGTPTDILRDNYEYVEQAFDADREDTTTGVLFLARTRGQTRLIGEDLRQNGVIYRGSAGSGGWSWDDTERRCAIYNALQKLTRFSADDWSDEWYGPEYRGDDNQHVNTRLTGLEAKHLLEVTPVSYWTDHEKAYDEARRRADPDEDADWSWSLKNLARHVTDAFWTELTNGADALDNLHLSGRATRYVKPALEHHTDPLPETPRPFRNAVPIQVQSIHASKGNEAYCTVVYDGITRRIHRSLSDRPDARENENRVWYVALTRATQKLCIAQGAYRWTDNYVSPILGGDEL